MREKQASLAVGDRGSRRVVLVLGSHRGVLFLPGVPDMAPHIVDKVPHRLPALKDSSHMSRGWGIVDQLSRPFQGSEHLPQTVIQASHIWLLVFWFFVCLFV